MVRGLWTSSSYLVVVGCSALSENELPDYKKLWAELMHPIYAHAVLVWNDVVTEGGWLGGCVMPNRREVKE